MNTSYHDTQLIDTNFQVLAPAGVEERIWMLHRELADRFETVTYSTDLYYYATQIIDNVCRAALACRENPDPWMISAILLTGVLSYTGPGADNYSDPVYLLSNELIGHPEMSDCTCLGDQTCPACREAAGTIENFTFIDLR